MKAFSGMKCGFVAATVCSFAAANGNVLLNPGFETGDLTGWTTSGFTAVDTDAHSGTWSAFTSGNNYIEQEFASIPDSQVTEVSMWIKQPNAGSVYINAVDLLYDDGSSNEFVPEPANSGGWAKEDVTSLLDPLKNLDGLRVWGYTMGGDADFTYYDDLVVNASVPEPASLAALGLGAIALIRRRQQRAR